MKYIPPLILFLLFFSCKGQKPRKVDSNNSIKLLAFDKETQQHYPKEYKIFVNQKHRIEILNCELYYNGKELMIGDSIQKVYKSIGEMPTLLSDGKTKIYKDLGTELIMGNKPIIDKKSGDIKEDTSQMVFGGIKIYFDYWDWVNWKNSSLYDDRNKMYEQIKLFNDYIMLDGIPINRYTKIEDIQLQIRLIKSLEFQQYGICRGNCYQREFTPEYSACVRRQGYGSTLPYNIQRQKIEFNSKRNVETFTLQTSIH